MTPASFHSLPCLIDLTSSREKLPLIHHTHTLSLSYYSFFFFSLSYYCCPLEREKGAKTQVTILLLQIRVPVILLVTNRDSSDITYSTEVPSNNLNGELVLLRLNSKGIEL